LDDYNHNRDELMPSNGLPNLNGGGSNGLTAGGADSGDPFLSHLVALVSLYELSPSPGPLPQYHGKTDWQMESIIRSVAAMARRMYSAEEALLVFRASHHSLDANKPQSLDRHGNHAPISASLTYGSSPFITPTPSESSADSSADFEFIDDQAIRAAVAAERSAAAPMSLSLNGLSSSLDSASALARPIMRKEGSTSAPQTSHADHVCCPTCGRTINDSMSMANLAAAFRTSVGSSPLVVPSGPLAAAAFESGMSAVEELRLLKAQVQDVARVCNAVARGDLSQKITVPVQGVVMVQLKDVINTMVPFQLYLL
jgi:osomolarity two-component system, sensor histidine kinase NIK1